MDAPRPGRAVVNGAVVYTSVSAINRFAECERSWWFRYVQGLPDPAGKAAQDGTEAHARLAHYLSTGEDVLGPIEKTGAALIPAPGPGLLIEHRIDGVLDLGGIPLIGGMDLLDERDRVAVLTDWKFKSTPGMDSADALKSADTGEGRQMLGYAEWYRRSRPEAKSVVLRHVHFATRKPHRAIEYRVEVGLDEVRNSWQRVADSYGNRLRRAARAETPEEVEPNTGYCYRFHKPCPFMAQCPLGGTEMMFTSREPSNKESKMGLLSSKMSNLPSENPSPAIPATVDRVPAEPEPIVGGAVSPEMFEGILEAGAKYSLPNGEQGRFERMVGMNAEFFVPREGGYGRISLPLSGVGKQIAEPVGLVLPPDAPLSPPGERVAPEATPADPPKRGRGRPRKTESATAAPVQGELTATVPATATATVPAPVLEVQVSAPSAPAASGSAINLYFAGAPVGVVTSTLHRYVSEIESALLAKFNEAGTVDIRLSRHDALTFGRWKAVLGAFAKENLPPSGHYLIGDEEKESAVAQALVPSAALVVLKR
jgi:hypothetical protein